MTYPWVFVLFSIVCGNPKAPNGAVPSRQEVVKCTAKAGECYQKKSDTMGLNPALVLCMKEIR